MSPLLFRFFANRGITMQATDYEQLELALGRAGAVMGASECHGTLCGLHCVGRINNSEQLSSRALAQEGGEQQAVADCRQALDELARHTRDILEHAGLEFEPLLPHDAHDLQARVEALSAWCQGFLGGLGEAGSGLLERLPEDSREVVSDLVEISRAGLEVDDSSLDEQEGAYAEIVEYVRVGVMLLLEDLNPRAPEAPVQDAPSGLH